MDILCKGYLKSIQAGSLHGHLEDHGTSSYIYLVLYTYT